MALFNIGMLLWIFENPGIENRIAREMLTGSLLLVAVALVFYVR